MTLVLASRADGVATLSLNRPERGNALGPELIEAWTRPSSVRSRMARAFSCCAGKGGISAPAST